VISNTFKIFFLASLCAGLSTAGTLTWTFSGTTVNSGPVSGSFVFDFDTNSVDSVAVTAPQLDYGGTSFTFDYGSTASTLIFGTSANPNGSFVFNEVLTINLATSLTASGGSVSISSTDLSEYEAYPTTLDRSADSVGGSVTAPSSAPEPASLGLVFAGVVGFALNRFSSKPRRA
jgi:hypothetical protein